MPIDDSCALRTARALERVGVEPDIVFRSDDNLTTQRLVAIGLGVAIVPLLTVERSIPDAQVAIRGLNTSLDRQIGIIWHRDRLQSRAAEAFIETAMQISSDVDMPGRAVDVVARLSGDDPTSAANGGAGLGGLDGPAGGLQLGADRVGGGEVLGERGQRRARRPWRRRRRARRRRR